jgi:hypothetical protein
MSWNFQVCQFDASNKIKDLNPPGFSLEKSISRSHAVADETNTKRLKLKKAWEQALGSAKQLPMNAVMLYSNYKKLIFSVW